MAKKNEKNVAVATENNATEAKKVSLKKAETENKEVQKEEAKKAENSKKENKKVDMAEINQLLAEAGIKVFNPNAKGRYRIFGNKKGSSLNVQTKQFIIYSTDDDFKLVEAAKIDGVTCEAGTNSQDKVRPNTVKIIGIETLKLALAVYAKNTANAAA